MTLVLLLNGPRQVGKNTIARQFMEDLPSSLSARETSIMASFKNKALARMGVSDYEVRSHSYQQPRHPL